MGNGQDRDFKGLYQAVSSGLNNRGKIKCEELPRMADFAVWAMETEAGLPWKPGTFVEAFAKSRKELIDDAIEADPVADAIMVLMEHNIGWSGTPTELWETLKVFALRLYGSTDGFPKYPNKMTIHLKLIKTFLREMGIEAKHDTSGNNRNWTLKRKVTVPPLPPPKDKA
jgi:hypothetical protein